ncbi:MAG: hypothetical protein K8R45_10390, partial [Desulfobacterales bacterium]|nr:hypothetical protein [Desulfobacterales bacterium]
MFVRKKLNGQYLFIARVFECQALKSPGDFIHSCPLSDSTAMKKEFGCIFHFSEKVKVILQFSPPSAVACYGGRVGEEGPRIPGVKARPVATL